jgi:hypothetical protein
MKNAAAPPPPSTSSTDDGKQDPLALAFLGGATTASASVFLASAMMFSGVANRPSGYAACLPQVNEIG